MLIVVATYPIRPCCDCTVNVRFWRKEYACRMKNIQVISPRGAGTKWPCISTCTSTVTLPPSETRTISQNWYEITSEDAYTDDPMIFWDFDISDEHWLDWLQSGVQQVGSPPKPKKNATHFRQWRRRERRIAHMILNADHPKVRIPKFGK